MKVKLLLFGLLVGLSAFAQSITTPADLVNAAEELCLQDVLYDPSYFKIDYPGGDVPADRGVCTDVVIRAYRKVGIDLQKEVHEHMAANFSSYPNYWGLTSTDHNIDHRRVPNLMTFFKMNDAAVANTSSSSDYLPGDLVCWDLGAGLKHIGIVIDEKSKNGVPLIVHNIGGGQVKEDVLFKFDIIGHYRYFPKT